MADQEDVQVEETTRSSRKNVWKCPGWSPDQLWCYRENHISHRPLTGTSTYKLRGYGHLHEVPGFFSDEILADDAFMDMIRGAGFYDFISVMKSMTWDQAYHPLVFSLLEWFWDTTNTFQFPWGEMTVTPFDFHMLSGLAFTETPVVVDNDLRTGNPEVRKLLGPIADTFPPGYKYVKPSLLLGALDDESLSRKRRARIILLLMINSFLVPDSGADTRCQLRYLASLKEPSRADRYDWAGLGYAQLLISMRRACRQRDSGVVVSITGPWRILEFWAYFYLPPLAPGIPGAPDFPATWCWTTRRTRRSQDILPISRRRICAMGVDEVQFRPFAGFPVHPSSNHARDLARSRCVFRTPTEAVFYLGERVVRQLHYEHFVTPADPPRLMMSPNLARHLGNDPYQTESLDLLLREDAPYDLHHLPRLAPRVQFMAHPVPDFAGGEVPGADLSIRYDGPSGPVQEVLGEAPEAEMHCLRSLPPGFDGFNREGSERMLRTIDSLKWHVRNLKAERVRWGLSSMPQFPQPQFWGFPGPQPPFGSFPGTQPPFQDFAGTSQGPQPGPYSMPPFSGPNVPVGTSQGPQPGSGSVSGQAPGFGWTPSLWTPENLRLLYQSMNTGGGGGAGGNDPGAAGDGQDA